MKRTYKKRNLAVLLAVCLIGNLCFPAVAAAQQENTGLGEHHPEQTAEAGYKEAAGGHGDSQELTAERSTDESAAVEGENKTASSSDADHGHTPGTGSGGSDTGDPDTGTAPKPGSDSGAGEPDSGAGNTGTAPKPATGSDAAVKPVPPTDNLIVPEVHNGLTRTVTSWEWIDPKGYLTNGDLVLPNVNADHPADFNKVVSMLPTQIHAAVEQANDDDSEEGALVQGAGETQVISLGSWTCSTFKPDGSNSWPVTGSYTFTTSLPGGITLADSVPKLEILVTLGGANLLTNAETGDFTVTGGEQGTDYSYEDHTLTVKSRKELTITNTTPGVATTDNIKIADNASANVTIKDLSIDTPRDLSFDTSRDAAILLGSGAELNLTLSGTSALKSGGYNAGLQAPKGTKLIIGGEGSLTASGGDGAGIGGGSGQVSGTIIINSGTITATGNNSAGIGGGSGAAGGTTTINGGIVTTTTGNSGAGIGGGYGAAGGTITINGGIVTATASYTGAGIGGGNNGGAGGAITITGGTVTATAEYNESAAIGGIGGAIKIKGGIVNALGGSKAASIGNSANQIDPVVASCSIEISGGTVTAVSGHGIGNSEKGSGSTFSTGTNGNAFIITSAISDQSSKDDWSGAIFGNETDDRNIGKVYGSCTLHTNAKIPAGKTLMIEPGNSLALMDGVTLTNEGFVYAVGNLTANSEAWKNKGDGWVYECASGTVSGLLKGPQEAQYTPFADIGDTFGDFTVSGGRFVTDFIYTADKTLKVLTGTPLTITNTDPATPATDTIAAAAGVAADITLDGVNINASTQNNKSALDLNQAGASTITLCNENTLRSGSGGPGVWVPDGEKVIFKGKGKLNAYGNGNAGIGRGGNGNIEFHSGTINAVGDSAAGIGGSWGTGGGAITISGGIITATTTAWTSAGIGGSYGCSGGTIKITGGIVNASGGSDAAAIGSGGSNFSFYEPGSIEISGGIVSTGSSTYGIGNSKKGTGSTFSTGAAGNAVIITNRISDNSLDKKANWSGVIFEGNDGNIYGAPALTTDFEIPEGKVLTVSQDKAFTINSGITLTNRGTITIETGGVINNNGIIRNYGTINGAVGGTVLNPSQVVVGLRKNGETITSAAYNDTIQVIAAVEAKTNSNVLRSSPPALDKVDFYLGSVDDANKLNANPVSVSDGKAAMDITLNGGKWKPGGAPYTIIAVYGGSDNDRLVDSQGSITFSISKAAFRLSGSETMIKKQANYTKTLDLTEISGYPQTPGGAPAFAVADTGPYNGLKSAAVSGSTLTLVADNTSNAEPDTVTVTVSGMDNYEDGAITIQVSYIDKTEVAITGVTAKSGLIYSGQPQQGYTGTPTGDYDGAYEISYAGTGETAYTSAAAPTNAGSYAVTFQVPDDNVTYSGSLTLNFSIGKKAAAVMPENKSVKRGDAMPGFHLVYQGLVNGETLTPSTAPTFSCDAADTSTPGIYTITWSNKDSTNFDGAAKNYDITKTGTATLTVAEKIFTLTVAGGGSGATASGGYAGGTTVSINAGTRNGYTFAGWTGSVDFADKTKAETTFTMPEQDVTITANWSIRSSGGGSDDTPSYTPPAAPDQQAPPVNGEANLSGEPDQNGNVAVTVPDQSIADAISAAKKQAGQNGISVTVNIQITQTANSLTATISRAALDKLVAENTKELKITSRLLSFRFNLDALKEMQKSAAGDLTVTAKKLDSKTLSKDAQAAINSRPVFDLAITSGGKAITNFGKGRAFIWFPYTPAAAETAGNLEAVYVDADGKVQWLPDSSYDTKSQSLLFTTGHFSVYGVGYRQDAPSFTDIGNHWAKADIEFVTARGLFGGAGTASFGPDTAVTRGMFVTALGQLAGSDSARYKNTGITNGAADQVITRQELAVMMQDYARAMGAALPRTRDAVTFADNGSIADWAAEAVRQMQMAGVMNGKDGNIFDPAGTATKAEAAAILHRYVELMADSSTAQGLDTNDSGSVMLYENGKAVKSQSRTVNGITYNFNANGEAALPPANKTCAYVVQKGLYVGQVLIVPEK